jgi:hypothetical protein
VESKNFIKLKFPEKTKSPSGGRYTEWGKEVARTVFPSKGRFDFFAYSTISSRRFQEEDAEDFQLSF